MARKNIRDHEHYAQIEYDAARGVKPRRIAAKYGCNLFAVYRLIKRLPPQLKAAKMAERLRAGKDLEELRISESESILQNLALQRGRVLLVQDRCLEVDDTVGVTQCATVIHKNLEIVGRYLGEFAQHSIQTNINVLVTPQYLTFRSKLMRALAPYPDARRAVAAALHATEAEAADPATFASKPMMIEHEPQHAA